MERGANMDTRNTVEITISGRRYKLSGNESAAYMQQVAEYVNGKYDKLKELPGFTSRSQDYQTLMMYLNLADDYLKKSGWTEEKQAVVNSRAEEEIYRLKLELVEASKQTEALEAARNEETDSLKKQLEVAVEERRRLAERERDASSRLSGAEKELESYKTETSILKRKVSDYVKSSAQVEKQLKDAAAREREEKLLRNKYETQLENQKAEYESRLSELQKQLAGAAGNQEEEQAKLREQYQKQIDDQEEQLVRLQKRVAAQQADYDNKSAEMQKQLAAAKAGYEVELERLHNQLTEQEDEYEDQLAEMRAEYENRISSMKPGYENLMTEQENEYEARLAEQKEASEEQLRKQAESYEARLAEQKEASEEQLRKQAESYEARLAEQKEASEEQLRKQNQDNENWHKKLDEAQKNAAQERAELFTENGELLKEKRQLQKKIQELTGQNQELTEQNQELTRQNQELTGKNQELTGKNQELTDKVQDNENDMVEYLDLIEEKDREIASLKFKLQEDNYA